MAANSAFSGAQTLTGAYSSLNELRINGSGDEAYYKFHLERSGAYRDEVKISFIHSQGDLRLDLYDAAGNSIGSSDISSSDKNWGDTNYESIGLSGLAAGDYFIKVSGVDGAANEYSLNWSLPGSLKADRLEGNDSMASASGLPGAAGSYASLNLHTPDDKDFYKVHLDKPGSAADSLSLSYNEDNGSIQAYLMDADGNNGQWLSSPGTLNLEGVPAGDYYLEISGYYANDYALSWSLPSSLPPAKDRLENNDSMASAPALSGETGEIKDLTLHTPSDADWFKFTLDRSGKASDSVSVWNNGSYCYSMPDHMLLALYDSNGKELQKDQQFLTLADSGYAPGAYYVKVYNDAGLTTHHYDLQWDFSPLPDNLEGNNSRNRAAQLNGPSGTLAGLTHHTASDQDWFQFSLSRPGRSSDIITAGGDTNVSLRLYDSAGKFVRDLSARSDLYGMKAGTYYILAANKAGKTTHSYSLSWSFLPPKDAYEAGKANNTRASAAPLTAASGTLKGLTHHTASDQDWFKFSLNRPGKASDIITAGGDPNVSLRLYDSAGKFVRDLSARPNLAGMKAGTYYIRAFNNYGHTESYSISWNFNPPEDDYEANNSRASAWELNGQKGTLANLTHHTAYDKDWFKFTLDSAGQSSDIITAGGDANVSLRLYNSAGQFVRDLSARRDLAGMKAGTYYILAANKAGKTTFNYSLSWNFLPPKDAYEAGRGNNTRASAVSLTAEAGTLKNLTHHTAQDKDWFKFTLSRTGTSNDLLYTAGQFYAQARLYNSAGKFIRDLNRNPSLSGLKAGSYYVMTSPSGEGTRSYSLSWDFRPPADYLDNGSGNNTRARAVHMSEESGTFSNLTHHTAYDKDWFKFNLTRKGESSDIISAAGDANVSLRLYNSAGKFVRDLSARRDLAGMKAGTYYVLAANKAGKTTRSYSLSWNFCPPKDIYDSGKGKNNDTRANAVLIKAPSGSIQNLTHHKGSDADWFKFTLDRSGKASDTISAAGTNGVALKLYSSSGKFVRDLSAKPNLAGMKAGTYYVLATNREGKTTSSYTLSWNFNPPADIFESNNSRAAATALHGREGFITGLTHHSAHDTDFFKLTLGQTGAAPDKISVSGSGDVYLRLYDSRGTQVKSFGKTISLAGLKAGQYYAKAYNAKGRTTESYSLSWSINASAPGDNYEPDNTAASAVPLNCSQASLSLQAAISSPADVDYYKIQLDEAGSSKDSVLLRYNSKKGGLGLDLYNSAGRLMASSSGAPLGSDFVSLNGLAAGGYYLKVYGVSGAVNNYSLNWSLPSASSASTAADSRGVIYAS